MRDIVHNPECFAQHMGLYLIEGIYLQNAVACIKAGTWPIEARRDSSSDPDRDLFEVHGEGVAVIGLSGPMMKGFSKFPHANTLLVRRAVRAAVRDDSVHAILLHVSSPGGMVHGTQELADDVHEADQVKPVYAHIEDVGASAAFWVASQARQVSANRSGEVGSIGAVALIHDTSEAAKMAGVEVHVISTGDFKSIGAPGVKVSKAHLKEIQGRVDASFEFFMEAVLRGRGSKGLTREALDKSADGRVFSAAEAMRRGLIDQVASLDEVLTQIDQDTAEALDHPRSRRARTGIARRRVGM